MKKLAIILAAALTLSTLTACGSKSGPEAPPSDGAPGDAQPKITWRAQSVETSGTERQNCVEHFAQLVSDATGGNFTIEVFSAGTLYGQEDLVEAVNNGVTECAFTSNDYHSGIEPMLKLAAFRSSDLWNDKELDETFLAMYEPLVKEAYDKMGLVYVGNVLDLPGECFMSNVKIQTIDDFQGVLIRSGGLGQELYSALGASVVSMPMGDVYSAAKLGTIDAFEVGGYADNYGNALHEVCKYVVEPTPHSTSGVEVGNLVVNAKAYNALPDEYKQILADCCKENRAYTFDRLTEAAAEAREIILDGGVECITLSDEDFTTIKSIAAETLQGYWGQSDLTDQFLTLYVEFLTDNGYPDVAAKVQK
ncbi:TRAP transporter substrate-binding protein [uncultured Oscillibacter sp.]|uniref:TRAP transporter substrate-binding protein n=1 Tax=uncultured Oscillibacter sp. TaxID=876091 RepID=UPI0025E38D1B|nr:TRAP transporter substrate-binding protein DctP [uncultured Oscillibacter sp.]